MRNLHEASPRIRLSFAKLSLVLGLSTAFLVGCERRAANDYASPESAAVAMFNAFARAQANPESAWAFLGPETRARLESLAAQGPAGIDPTSYLRFGWVPNEALIADVKRVRESGRTATLRMTTEFGDSFEIEMIRSEDGWQAELGVVPPPQNQPIIPTAPVEPSDSHEEVQQ